MLAASACFVVLGLYDPSVTRRFLLAFVTIALASAPRTAAGDPTGAADAERLYREGTSLLEAGRLDPACEKLAESQRIDPAPGAALALGVCRERQGRVASAVAAYGAAARLARAAGDEERAAAADARTIVLGPRVPKLEVTLGPTFGDATLELFIDGAARGIASAAASRIDVDPGPHVVLARRGERASAPASFEAREGATTSLTLEAPTVRLVAPPPPPRSPRPRPPPSPPAGMSAVRALGLTALGTGALSLGAGAIFAITGASQASELEGLGYDGARGTCREQLPSCRAAFADAATAADASTVLFLAGGTIAAVGVTLVVIGGDEDAEGARLSATSSGLSLRGWSR